MRSLLVTLLLFLPIAAHGQDPLDNPALAHLPLTLTGDTLAYCQLPRDAATPSWAAALSDLTVEVRTPSEHSVLALAHGVPGTADCIRDFRPLRLDPLDEDITGVIATLSRVLARANVSIYVVSTRMTDVFLVHLPDVERAVDALRKAGHRVRVKQ